MILAVQRKTGPNSTVVSRGGGTLPVFLGIVIACAGPTRPHDQDEPDAGDTDTETVSDIDWDTDQGDFHLPVPILMVGNEGTKYYVSIAVSEGRIAVAGIYDFHDLEEDYSEGSGTLLATIDTALEENPVAGSYPHDLYPIYYAGEVAAYPADDGFLLLESRNLCTDDELHLELQLTISAWNGVAELVDGPTQMGNIWDPEPDVAWVPPWGILQADGSVLLGLLNVDNGDDTVTGDETVLYQVSRVEADGTHETFAGPEVYPWVAPSLEAGGFLNRDTGTYRFDDRILTVAASNIGEYFWPSRALVAAQADFEGTVTLPPTATIFFPEEDGVPPTEGRTAFAARDGEVLAVSTLGYHTSETTCVTRRLATRLSSDGEPIAEPVAVSVSPLCMGTTNDLGGSGPGATWSGRFYGYCDLEYRNDVKVYSFWLLDETGAVASGPVDVFWEFADLEFPYACDVAALGEERFAVALAVPHSAVHTTWAPLVDTPGLWLTVVDYQGPE